MKQAPQTLLIVWPPSVNSIWRAVNGRNIVSKRYREWKEHAGRTLLSQRPKKIKGPVSIAIELTPPDKRARDLDNHVKPIFDLLVTHQIVEADDCRTIREFLVSLENSEIPGARVTISPIAEAA